MFYSKYLKEGFLDYLLLRLQQTHLNWKKIFYGFMRCFTVIF